nr:RIB43A-like with coiled-coils protein 1 [Nothobranchius furzeri]
MVLLLHRDSSVNMYRVDLPVDQSMERAIDKRRSAEAERKAWIYNTRLRVMGLDVDALNKQVQEKKLQQHTKKQQDKAWDMLRNQQDRFLLQRDIDEKEKRKATFKDLTQYWASQQQVEDSSDADLNLDLKGAFKTTVPEGKLGPASMQIFHGEDVGCEQTRREQMKKTQKDLQAQMDDKERRHREDKHQEMLVNRAMVHQDLRKGQMDAHEEELKKASRVALNNYNQTLAAEQEENRKEQRWTEERENSAEIWHTMTSDMMTERVEAPEGAVGGGRPPQILSDRWKGMSSEQLSALHREREQQRLDRQRQIDAKKIKKAAWDLQLLKLSREADEEEKRAAELRRQQRVEMDQFNRQLAREQQMHQEYLKKLYTNKPTEDYFHHFNSSSR